MSGFLQLPAIFSPAHPKTHETAGLPGYPATDVFGTPGTLVGAPVGGIITKLSGQAGGPGGGGAFGYSVYIDGDNGESYYLTHLGSRTVSVGQQVKRGQVIGTIADYPDRADHVHEGIHDGWTGITATAKTTGGGVPGKILNAAGDVAGVVGGVAGGVAGIFGGGIPGLPGIPSIPGVPNPTDVVGDLAGGIVSSIFGELGQEGARVLLYLVLAAGGIALVWSGANAATGGGHGPTDAAKTAGQLALTRGAGKAAGSLRAAGAPSASTGAAA